MGLTCSADRCLAATKVNLPDSIGRRGSFSFGINLADFFLSPAFGDWLRDGCVGRACRVACLEVIVQISLEGLLGPVSGE